MEGLYSPERPRKVWALEVVALWRARGRLPHSADSSAFLVEVLLNDNNDNSSDSSTYRVGTAQRSESELRLAYGIVIIRAVNGLVDSSQQGYFAGSVSTLAERIGLPTWIVELRHDATHQNLPSLQSLRVAAHHLMGWYYDNYWYPQFSFLSHVMQSVHSMLWDAGSDEDQEKRDDLQVNGMMYVRETTFLTNTFIPELLQVIFYNGDEENDFASDPDNLQPVLRCLLEKSIHPPLSIANTILLHMVASAIEFILANEAEGNQNVARLISSCCIWAQRINDLAVKISIQDPFNPSDTHSSSAGPPDSLATLCANGMELMSAEKAFLFCPLLEQLFTLYGRMLSQKLHSLLVKRNIDTSLFARSFESSSIPSTLETLESSGASSANEDDSGDMQGTVCRPAWPLGTPPGYSLHQVSVLHLLEEA